MQHNWRTLIPANDPKRFVKGHEVDVSIPDGYLSRFAIYAVRVIRPFDFRYRIRDAHTVNDQQLRDGVRPSIVGEFETLDEAENFINNQSV